ncbi:hypothetical protein RRG08_043187 [Elysia crispata]|uniref:Mutator-like transposase domain-containing protein n=1 Tax=Elysia crispata TaxID=231223 RepID=A0AAE1DHI3_9GAST|nr:hypothetical protein RRG08_043187 [Elysia crispata]
MDCENYQDNRVFDVSTPVQGQYRSFQSQADKLYSNTQKVRDVVFSKAAEIVRKEHAKCDPSVAEPQTLMDIVVSYDGSWLTRGHTSLIGVGCVIHVLTGLVLDAHVMSSYCQSCENKKTLQKEDADKFAVWERHLGLGECNRNFFGTAGMMEVHASKIMWARSVMKHNMRYTIVVSDGDSKSFNAVSEMRPYGPDCIIEKEDCINHVRRMLSQPRSCLAHKRALLKQRWSCEVLDHRAGSGEMPLSCKDCNPPGDANVTEHLKAGHTAGNYTSRNAFTLTIRLRRCRGDKPPACHAEKTVHKGTTRLHCLSVAGSVSPMVTRDQDQEQILRVEISQSVDLIYEEKVARLKNKSRHSVRESERRQRIKEKGVSVPRREELVCQAERRQCIKEKGVSVSQREETVYQAERRQCIKEKGVSVSQREETVCQAERRQCITERGDSVSRTKESVYHRERRQCINERGDSVPQREKGDSVQQREKGDSVSQREKRQCITEREETVYLGERRQCIKEKGVSVSQREETVCQEQRSQCITERGDSVSMREETVYHRERRQ